MKQLLVLLIALGPVISFAQEENEILKISKLRAKFDCLKEVKVFPNPATNNRVTIDTPRDARCQIFNLSGVLIDEMETSMGRAEFTTLSQGTYIAVVHIDGMITQQKFVVL